MGTYSIHQLKDGWYISCDMAGEDTVLTDGTGGPYPTQAAAQAMVAKFEIEDATQMAKRGS